MVRNPFETNRTDTTGDDGQLRSARLSRRSYLTGSTATALGVSGLLGSMSATADDTDTDSGTVLSLEYDDYDDPQEIYDINDVRGSHVPTFATDRSTRGDRSLYTTFTGEQKIANCEYRFPQTVGSPQDEVYTRFKLYPEGFALNPDDTIRVFWAPLTNGTGSSGGGASNGANGWSNAIGFANRNNSPAPDGYKFFSYSYHMDNSGSGDFQMTDAVVQMDEWNELECYIKVNTFENGTANPDGVMRYWVNGELAFEDTTMRFTTTEDNRIEAVGPLGYAVGTARGSLYYDHHDICLDMDREAAREALEE